MPLLCSSDEADCNDDDDEEEEDGEEEELQRALLAAKPIDHNKGAARG